MDRETARQEIRSSWRKLYPADKKGKGIICPLCGSGSGAHGTGITENPQNPGQLKCWSCGFQGDVIDLIQQEQGVDFNTALKAAADDLYLDIEPYRATAAEDFAETAQNAQNGTQGGFNDSAHKEKGQQHETPGNGAQDVTGATVADYTEYYKKCRANLGTQAALLYLAARGISPDTAAAYNLGYDPAWISPTAIERHRAKGDSWTPPATARIIMPVSKNHYVARAISPDAEKKYAKMNETGNGKSGIFNDRAFYGDRDAVFVVEGIFDALSIIETGAAAAALNSTSNADLLIKQLEKRPTKATVILCLDNDEAGKKAAATIKEGLARLNVSYVTADICGQYKDPNDALIANRTAFAAAVQRAEAKTAAKPDNTLAYIDSLMSEDIARFSDDIKTGFKNLDRAAGGGIYAGLYVLAAISSLGKTSFALQLCDQLAAQGRDVLFFSLEQSRLELVSKSLARWTVTEDAAGLHFDNAVTSLAIRKGFLPQQVLQAAEDYKKAVGDRVNIIEGNFNCDISFIGDYIRQYVKRNNCRPVVFIDYLQILQPVEDNKRMSTKETVDNAVTELKRISRELELTLFVISSVNRANYLTPIDYESLKESGGIEYSADVVWGLQLQCLNDPLFEQANKLKEKRQKVKEAKAETPRKIELCCLKNRYGIANYTCSFNYYPASDLFREQGDAQTDFKTTEGNGQRITASF